MLSFSRRLIAPLAVAVSLLGMGAKLNAQATKSATEHPDSRVDIYGGYGYFHPINSGVGLEAVLRRGQPERDGECHRLLQSLHGCCRGSRVLLRSPRARSL